MTILNKINSRDKRRGNNDNNPPCGKTIRQQLRGNFMKKVGLISLVYFIISMSSAAVAATGITSFEDFLMGVHNAKFKQYSDIKDARVRDEGAFEEMKKHIVTHYQSVLVTNSFIGQSGRIIDCVITETQPSLQVIKMIGHKIAKPPKPLVERVQKSSEKAPTENYLQAQLGENKTDQFMNSMFCEPGTIPLTRLTLPLITRFLTLTEFFMKVPNDTQTRVLKKYPASRVKDPVPGDDDYTHYWAHGRQTVNNYGGDSRLNVWKPNAEPGWFSLAQHWYVGGSGANKQTVEGGWQVAERKYNNTNPNLFIYSTSANYSSGSGCYNLDCSDFVQINNSWVIGGQLGPVSTLNGTQYIFRMQWQYSDGNWWLFLKGRGAADPGVADYHAIGYYPEEHFDGGQLTEFATKIDYGGEVSSLLGDIKTGEMGSGRKAAEGWEKAAYQRTIYYIDTNHVSHWANLTKVNNTADCYTADVHNQTSSSWATYLYFGGEKCPVP